MLIAQIDRFRDSAQLSNKCLFDCEAIHGDSQRAIGCGLFDTIIAPDASISKKVPP